MVTFSSALGGGARGGGGATFFAPILFMHVRARVCKSMCTPPMSHGWGWGEVDVNMGGWGWASTWVGGVDE